MSANGLLGRWLCGVDCRWRGGLAADATHEVRYVLRAQRIVVLLAPEATAGLTFTRLRRALSGWTRPDDHLCVRVCGAAFDASIAALHTITAPSKEFPSIQAAGTWSFGVGQAALDAVPVDEPLHRVLLRKGVHLVAPLVMRGPILLEGEGRWETTLICHTGSVLRLEGPKTQKQMAPPMSRECHISLCV